MRRPPGLGVLSAAATRLEVWGDPIEHSRSPQLHGAAYTALGREWTYGRRRVTEPAFASELASLDASWRGLSLTMPLKAAAFAAAASVDRHASLTRVANTLLFTDGGPRAFNTDVGGLRRALVEDGIETAARARVIGAGATATSAVIALSEIDVRAIEVVARRPESVAALRPLGETLGVAITARGFDDAPFDEVPVTIAALPGEARIPDAAADALAAAGGQLIDVVYGHWPTILSQSWQRAGRAATSGRGMLLHQALLQVRIFVTGDVDVPLDDETSVLAEMRLALMGD